MCLAIPVQVVELLDSTMAKVRVGSGPTTLRVSSMLLPEPPRLGDWLIVHAGFALRVMDPEEAAQSLQALRAYASASEEAGRPA